MSIDLKTEYFRAATQYYIVGRFAAFPGFTPVCGNLFHHSIEMYLKGHLCKNFTTKQLKNWNHRLEKIWEVFKEQFSGADLDRFDETISDVDEFDIIRYPEKIIELGMISIVDFNRSGFFGDVSAGPQPAYKIYVDEIDSLVRAIFEKARINPLFVKGGLGKEAITYLKKQNKEANFWGG